MRFLAILALALLPAFSAADNHAPESGADESLVLPEDRAPAEAGLKPEIRPALPAPAGKVAVSVATRQTSVVFTTPSGPQPGRAFVESITAGAAIGAAPLMACGYGGCAAAGLWAPALAAAGIGVIGGAVVGVVREIFRAASDEPPAPAFAPAEIASATPTLDVVAAGALADAALLECIRRKLESVPRAADIKVVLDAAAPTYADLARDGFHYLVEAYLSRVTLFPAGKPGQKPEEVPAMLLVEGGISVVDLPRGTSQDREIVQYRTETRTLREWSASDGTAFHEELKLACSELGASVAAEVAKLRHGQ